MLTLFLIAGAAQQQYSGRADVSSPGRSFQRNSAERATKPEEYKNLMTYQWIRAILPGAAGLLLLHMIRRAERLDPMSPDFQGKAAIDQLAEYLEHEKKKR